MKGRYIIDYNLKNGLGKPAVSLYLRGCDKPLKCLGCHNHELQEISKDNYNIDKIIKNVENKYKSAILFNKETKLVFLGGEPTAKYNIDIVFQVSKYFKENYENVETILYSWRNLEKINCVVPKEKLKYIDYGVLGSYNAELHIDSMLPASTNQYIYDFKNDEKLEAIKIKR